MKADFSNSGTCEQAKTYPRKISALPADGQSLASSFAWFTALGSQAAIKSISAELEEKAVMEFESSQV